MASTRARRSTSLTWASSIWTLPSWMRSWWLAGRTFSASSRGMLTLTVSPLASELLTRPCSQRYLDADVVAFSELDWPVFAGAEVACAEAPSGDARSAVAAMRAVLANKVLYRSDITSLGLEIVLMRLDMKRCLLTGAGAGS